jgi:hypothetical protein
MATIDEGRTAISACKEAGEAPLSGEELNELVAYFQERSRICVEATKGGFLRGISATDALVVALGEIWSRGELASITALHQKGKLVNSLRRACAAQHIDFPMILAFIASLVSICMPVLDSVSA